MAKIFKIKLSEIKIYENGYFDRENGVNTMEASLIYPLPNVAAVKSIRPLELKKLDETDPTGNKKVSYKNSYSENNLEKLESLLEISEATQMKKDMEELGIIKSGKQKRIRSLDKLKTILEKYIREKKFDLLNFPVRELLFKQNIQDYTHLEIQISAVRKIDKYEKLIINILSAGAKAGAASIKALSDLNAGLTAMVTNSANSLIDMFSPQDKNLTIAYGITKISENFSADELKVDLFMPITDGIKTPKDWDDFGRVTEWNIKNFEKGKENGYVKFKIERL
ncbi:MAG: hypothetical protein KAW12_03425 [Candidatus Aminicenantes bacterium]|nr:hypothetical protein [Candidatus Aminicenantes bacterium]